MLSTRHTLDSALVRRTSEAFQSRWVLAHLAEAEAAVRKPLLLEEFGKKLSAPEYTNGSIGAVRDPIFASMYRTVEEALAQCAYPLANMTGVFWTGQHWCCKSLLWYARLCGGARHVGVTELRLAWRPRP